MAQTLAETVRQYSVSNGGHATNAAVAGVTTAAFTETVNGKRKMTSQIATAMAPLVGVRVSALMAEDQDYQLLARKGTAG